MTVFKNNPKIQSKISKGDDSQDSPWKEDKSYDDLISSWRDAIIKEKAATVP